MGWDGVLHTLGGLELLGLACASDTARETAEGDDLLVLADVRKVGVCLGELKACFHPSILISSPIDHSQTHQSKQPQPPACF